MSAPTLSGTSLHYNNESFVDDLSPVDEDQPATFTQRGGPSFAGDDRDATTGDSYVPPPSESTIRIGAKSIVDDRSMLNSRPEAPGLDGVVRDTKTKPEFGDQSSETKTPGLTDVVHQNQSDANSGDGETTTYKEVNPTQYFVEEDDEDEDDD